MAACLFFGDGGGALKTDSFVGDVLMGSEAGTGGIIVDRTSDNKSGFMVPPTLAFREDLYGLGDGSTTSISLSLASSCEGAASPCGPGRFVFVSYVIIVIKEVVPKMMSRSIDMLSSMLR